MIIQELCMFFYHEFDTPVTIHHDDHPCDESRFHSVRYVLPFCLYQGTWTGVPYNSVA